MPANARELQKKHGPRAGEKTKYNEELKEEKKECDSRRGLQFRDGAGVAYTATRSLDTVF